jgi:endonuclease/exonuclease/phosphatase family metal-dependent hydrolase
MKRTAPLWCFGVQPGFPRLAICSPGKTARIDHIFIDPAIKVTDIEVPSTELVRVASDHLPLIAEISLPQSNS